MKCLLCKAKAIDFSVCKKHEAILKEGGWQPVTARKCKIDNCEETSISLGLCIRHYGQHRLEAAEKCSFEGCNKKAHTKGLCRGHYNQHWQGKKLRPLGYKEQRKCDFPECYRKMYAKGLCVGHYKQQQRNQELKPLRV